MTRTLRIALTADPEIPVPPKHYGGIERVVDMLVCGLVSRGHEVTLFAHPDSGHTGHQVPWLGRSSTSLRDSCLNATTLVRHLMFGHFDLVHSFSRLAYLVPILPVGIPKIMTYQRPISVHTTKLANRIALGSLTFTAISRSMVAAASLTGIWHVVPNGVPLNTFNFESNPGTDAPLVFLGRIEQIKGPHLAIDVARRTGRALIIAGNIPDEHRRWAESNVLKQVDGHQIRYIGPVDDTQKCALLGNACALLMPILWDEPFGIVMAEAMACGTPVIALCRGAVPEVVEDGVTGFVGNGIEDLVAAVGEVDRIDRQACRDRVVRLYSNDAVVEGYLEVYRSVLARRRSAA